MPYDRSYKVAQKTYICDLR